MIPSDHFVRFYNEVFKALEDRGHEHLVAYWRELGRLQTAELADRFRAGGLQAAHDYWRRILDEENCQGQLTLSPDYLELRMDRCPSLSKVLDSDAVPSPLYCDHCMAWIQPVMEASGLHAVLDMHSRTQPRCLLRVYRDPAQAAAFERQAVLASHPYSEL
ncbi:MAG: hypothetical protein FJ291_03455 [Planctomycetes bacterium]|nr:hypothetical protein [Planctomycetota bacterium]